MSRSSRFRSSLATFVTVSSLASLSAPARGETLLRLEKFEPGALQVQGIELRRAGQIDIEAVGVRPRWEHELIAYAWILDSRTREPVWEMETDDSERVSGQRLLRKATKTLDLPAGRYEVYAWAADVHGEYWHSYRVFGFNFSDDGNWGRDSRRVEEALDDCYMTLDSKTLTKADVTSFTPTGELPGSLLRFAGLENDSSVRSAFRLDAAAELEIYAFTELPNDWELGADTGWIENMATHERVWKMGHRNTRPAGGADKNRVFRDSVRLDKGDYVLVYGTDDSHAYPEWNARPPLDPLNWGVTLLPGKNFPAGVFHRIEAPTPGEALVDLTRARDDDALEQAFRLTRESELWIRGVGEYSEGEDEFADYGWIQKAGSSEIVWEMTYDNTNHAGGAEKNRMFDGRVRLPAGDYVAYYYTDDSHSYRRWNASPPFERDAWGLAIFPGAGFRSADFQKLDSEALARNVNVLVRIVQVGDDERMRERFSLEKATKVHIYALGEGTNGDMADYGMIENAKTGEVVWEMTWRNTRHAGGAHKNRVFDGELTLQPGTYEVFYETDDSHAFGSWNAAKPRDPKNWGITVSQGDH
ncbi:MAG TPA: hypothetical protein VFE28_09450 [Candidatus Krumholzibacteria bacterium]|nr:hypothetical protein [Candidatus Krumholzibacteria bacterium]